MNTVPQWAAEAATSVPPSQSRPSPIEALDDAADEGLTDEIVQWAVLGWDPSAPFRGDLVFADQYGDVLLSLPVQPETMRSLRDITDAVLTAQYAAFGQAPDGPADMEGSAAPGRPQSIRDLKVQVNPAAMKMLGVGAVIVVVLAIVGMFTGG